MTDINDAKWTHDADVYREHELHVVQYIQQGDRGMQDAQIIVIFENENQSLQCDRYEVKEENQF